MGNGDIPTTLELVCLILFHIYALVALLVDDHLNIVQQAQLFTILAYVGIIESNSGFSGDTWCLGGCHLLIEPLWWFYNSFVEVTLAFVTPTCTSVPSLAIFSHNTSKVV